MISVFNARELKHLLEDFHRITRIRITVFDEGFREIVSFPENRPTFCQIIRSCDAGRRACAACDARACAYAAGQKQTHIYRCHAGLTEAIVPLHADRALVGYLLFGHVFAYDSVESGWATMESLCREYPVDLTRLRETLSEMPRLSRDYIRSAAQILRMTASYLVMERMATLQEGTVAARLDAYLSEHYARPITAERLCQALHVGRSKLFQVSRELYGCGIRQRVRALRMERARQLLLDRPDLSIMEIAAACGYSDYNYFIAAFSRENGKPPNHFRRDKR